MFVCLVLRCGSSILPPPQSLGVCAKRHPLVLVGAGSERCLRLLLSYRVGWWGVEQDGILLDSWRLTSFVACDGLVGWPHRSIEACRGRGVAGGLDAVLLPLALSEAAPNAAVSAAILCTPSGHRVRWRAVPVWGHGPTRQRSGREAPADRAVSRRTPDRVVSWRGGHGGRPVFGLQLIFVGGAHALCCFSHPACPSLRATPQNC